MLESGMASCESISPFRDSIDLAVIEPRSFPLIQIRTTLVQTMGEDKRSVTELTWKEDTWHVMQSIKLLTERHLLSRSTESNWYLAFFKILLSFVRLIGHLGIFFVVIINLFTLWPKTWILSYLTYGCCLFPVVWRYLAFIGSFINYG